MWIVSSGLLVAQSAAPELVIQRADSRPCLHATFSHDAQLLATDTGDEVLLWEISTGKLLNTMKPYRSPEIKHMKTGSTLMASVRAKGTVVFSPDDKIVAVLPVDFAYPLICGLAISASGPCPLISGRLAGNIPRPVLVLFLLLQVLSHGCIPPYLDEREL